MSVMKKTEKKDNAGVLLRMHPLHRIALGVLLSVITFFVLPKDVFSPPLIIVTLWIVYASTFLITSWIVLFRRPVHGIRKAAKTDDGSAPVVFALILLASFASLFTVLLLIISKDSGTPEHIISIPAAVLGMFVSWVMVHTVFTFHYAHIFYNEVKSGDHKGLDFPDEEEPDYIDFAYFSFVIGCTFQVSDVQITSRKIRRLVFLHSLLSFGINTFVVALTINMIAGLK
ncbi:MAG: putative rane protein [Bacteroidetes bacterium]|nr:putative rane protein [Bacteroidota bacterium]